MAAALFIRALQMLKFRPSELQIRKNGPLHHDQYAVPKHRLHMAGHLAFDVPARLVFPACGLHHAVAVWHDGPRSRPSRRRPLHLLDFAAVCCWDYSGTWGKGTKVFITQNLLRYGQKQVTEASLCHRITNPYIRSRLKAL